MSEDRNRVAEMLRRFVNGTSSPWEFDDFISTPQRDIDLEEARVEILAIPNQFPADTADAFASERGLDRIVEISKKLLGSQPR